jgi:hypothetical protein
MQKKAIVYTEYGGPDVLFLVVVEKFGSRVCILGIIFKTTMIK